MTYANSSVSVTTSVTASVTASGRFQSKLKETKNFGDALVEIFSDLVQLEIVTWVAHEGDVTHKTGNRLKTTINLIDGDIENELGGDFAGFSYAELRGFHEIQVEKGAETIANNLKTLVDIGHKVTGLLNGGKEEDELEYSADLSRDRYLVSSSFKVCTKDLYLFILKEGMQATNNQASDLANVVDKSAPEKKF